MPDPGIQQARLVIEQSRDPRWNLALEEALLDAVCKGGGSPVFRVWINERSIIIGRTLGTCEEVHCKAAEDLGIPVIRRPSGGGAVYHDNGNINFTLIMASRGRIRVDKVYEAGLRFVLKALSLLGVKAWVENGNDVIVDGWKVSGSSAHIRPCGYLFHATLLVDADMGTLHTVIKPRLDRVARGEVTPAKYRPRNLEDLAGVKLPEALSALLQAVETEYGLRASSPTPKELGIAEALYRLKYSNPQWNIKAVHPDMR